MNRLTLYPLGFMQGDRIFYMRYVNDEEMVKKKGVVVDVPIEYIPFGSVRIRTKNDEFSVHVDNLRYRSQFVRSTWMVRPFWMIALIATIIDVYNLMLWHYDEPLYTWTLYFVNITWPLAICAMRLQHSMCRWKQLAYIRCNADLLRNRRKDFNNKKAPYD